MSDRETIAEIAEREAREAETEAPDDDTQPEADQPATRASSVGTLEAEPAAPQIDFEKAQRQLESEAKRHTKRVAEIMGGAFADVHDCPLCQIAGYVFPFQPGAPMDEDRRLAVEAYFGAGALPLKMDENKEVCPTCDGYGMLRTPSRRPPHDECTCGACGATGWIQKAAKVQPVEQFSGGTSSVPNGSTGTGLEVAPDLWGRPFGHPHFGMHPAAVGAGA